MEESLSPGKVGNCDFEADIRNFISAIPKAPLTGV